MKRSKSIKNNEVSKIVEVELANIKQKIMIEGKSKDLPIVIYLHGGPGNPLPFAMGTRGLNKEITDRCIFVLWDQYGCGINYAKFSGEINIEFFVKMSFDLIKYISKTYPNNKLYLFGVSYGSILASYLGIFASDYIDGIIVYGQVLHSMIYNNVVKEELLLSAAPDRVKDKYLMCMNDPGRRIKNIPYFMRAIHKYTKGFVVSNKMLRSYIESIWGCITSPDYKIKDVYKMFNNSYTKNNYFLDGMISINLEDEMKKIKVPYLILQGEYDIITPTKFIKKYVKNLENINVKIKVIKNSSHIPSSDSLKKIIKEFNNMDLSSR